MPRVGRKESRSGYYHIMLRGNNKGFIFSKSSEKNYFLMVSKELADELSVTIDAWCIMNNHVHLLISTDLDSLAELIKRVNVCYALRYHRVNESSGHVFQGRYVSQPVESDDHIRSVICYIHNNPVKVGLSNKPENYRWSSYKEYLISDEKSEIMHRFFENDISFFKEYHLKKTIVTIIDTKEDIEIETESIYKESISRFMEEYKVQSVEAIKNNDRMLSDVVNRLVSNERISLRYVSKKLGVSYSKIQRTTIKK